MDTFGYSKSAADDKNNNRKTLPLKGSFAISGGQGPRELVLTTANIVSAGHEHSWEGISGTPVFSTEFGEHNGLVGIITAGREELSKNLFALPAERLFEDIDFRSEIYLSSLIQLPDRSFCLRDLNCRGYGLWRSGAGYGMPGSPGFRWRRAKCCWVGSPP